jgi:hypothetical protein
MTMMTKERGAPVASPVGLTRPVIGRLLWVRGLRAFADGYVSLLLPIYLTVLGMSPFRVGVIVTAPC